MIILLQNNYSVKDVSILLEEHHIKAAPKTIYGWESGQSQPSADVLLTLCEIYNIENILSTFKNELGYVDATNQYVELSVRMTEKDYGTVLKRDLRRLAQSVNLNVSSLTEDYMCRISKSYIVSVNSCFENFLKSFRHLAGSPTNITENKKTREDDWLEWTLNVAFSSIENDIKNDIVICEYYRLIRNSIVHNGVSSATLKNRCALIKTIDTPRLIAPNGLDSLTFDDQVLFSRAAYNVAKYIFNKSQYDINTIVEAHKENLIEVIKHFKEPASRSRAAKKMKHFIGLLYPELTNVNWEQEVDKLLG